MTDVSKPDIPDPVLLGDGAVMVFVESANAPEGYESQRVGPGDDDHAYWVGQAQIVAKPDVATSKGLVNLGYITAILVPLIGFVLGIVVATRPDRRISKHGARIIALSIIVFVVGFVVIVSSINHRVKRAQQTLTTELHTIQQRGVEEQADIKQRAYEEQKATIERQRQGLESKMVKEKAIVEREPEGSATRDLAEAEYESDRAQLQQLSIR